MFKIANGIMVKEALMLTEIPIVTGAGAALGAGTGALAAKLRGRDTADGAKRGLVAGGTTTVPAIIGASLIDSYMSRPGVTRGGLKDKLALALMGLAASATIATPAIAGLTAKKRATE